MIPGEKSSRRVRECGNAEKILKGARGKGKSRETVRAKRKAEQREVKLVRGHRKRERKTQLLSYEVKINLINTHIE